MVNIQPRQYVPLIEPHTPTLMGSYQCCEGGAFLAGAAGGDVR
jgi:hypothetical protein